MKADPNVGRGVYPLATPALGRAPQGRDPAGSARSGPGGSRPADPPSVLGRVSTADRRGGGPLSRAGRDRPPTAPQGAVPLASVDVAQGPAAGERCRAWRRASAVPSRRRPNPSVPRFAGSRPRWRGWRRSWPRPLRFSKSRETLPGGRDSASATGRTADGRHFPRSAGRHCAGLSGAGGVSGHVLPPPEARSRASAAPYDARPGPERGGAGAGPRPARLPAFRRSFPGRGRGHDARRRTVPGLGAHEVPHPLCPAAGAGTAPPALRTRSGPGTSHGCSGRRPGLPSTSTCCSTSSAATWWDGGSPSARARPWPAG